MNVLFLKELLLPHGKKYPYKSLKLFYAAKVGKKAHWKGINKEIFRNQESIQNKDTYNPISLYQ